MARKNLVVSFSPGTGPFDTPSWVTLTAGGTYGNRVASAEWSWGRERDDEGFPPGSGTITLRNHDRLFDPENTASALFGDLTARVPFRLRADTGEDLFYGFVEDGWEQTYEHPEDGICTVQLVDLLAVLEGRTLPGMLEKAIAALGPVGLWPLDGVSRTGKVADKGSGRNDGEVDGSVSFGGAPCPPGMESSASFSGTPGHILCSRAPIVAVDDCSIVVTMNSTAVPPTISDKYPLFGQYDGNGNGNNNSTRVELLIWQAAFSDDYGSPAVGWYDLADGSSGGAGSPVNVTDGRDHIIFAQTGTARIAVDSAVHSSVFTSGGSNYGNGVMIGGTKSNFYDGRIGIVALFDYQLTQPERQTILDAFNHLDGARSDEQIAWALDELGVPAGLRNLDEGRSIMGPARAAGADALEFIRQVTDTEHGQFYVDHADGGKLRFVERFSPWLATRSTVSQATFSDDPANSTAVRVEPGTLVVEPDGMRTVVNTVTVQWVDGEETAEAAASVAAYGPRGRSITTVASTPAHARSLAQWVAELQAEPSTRVRGLGINPAAAEDGFDVAVEVRVGDLVTHRSQPSATGSVTTRELLVQGITHRVEDREWTTSYFTAATPAAAVSLFILDTSELDGPDVLGY